MKLLVPLMFLALATPAVHAEAFDREHQIKAAFIGQFVKFIEWPDLGPAKSNFVIGIYRADSFGSSIEDALAGKVVAGHPIVVEHIHSDAEIRHCRLVVSGCGSEERIASLSKLGAATHTVLVGETEDFAKFGGVIGLVVVPPNVRFEVNLVAARRAGVAVSSKLLSLAKVVYKEP
ncbi:MAG: YfiR family protein [Armatimonadetes bacterium]|nr:YfiR family protein [Armatimonadota bacterium]